MKLDLSKLSVALMAAGLTFTASTTCLAHTQYNRHAVTVPDSQARYNISLTGLYLRASNDDLTFASTTVGEGLGGVRYHSLRHNHDLGGSINVGFELNNSGNDIAANWTHLSSNETSRKSGADVTPRYFVGPVLVEPSSVKVKGKSEFTFNEVNVEVGQKVDFCQLHTRFHMGLSYASLDHDLKVNYDQVNGRAYGYSKAKSSSEFKGLGPRVGVDIAYPFTPCNNFAVVAHAAGSLLAGKIEHDIHASANFYGQQDELLNSSKVRAKSDDQYTVVPAGTLKLGLRYASSSEPGDCGWSIEGGWQATSYIHSVSNAPGFGSNAANSLSSYGNHGFYLTLGYAG